MTDVLHVDSDLMGSSGENLNLYKGGLRQLAHHLIVASAPLAFPLIQSAADLVFRVLIDLVHYLLRSLGGKTALDYVFLGLSHGSEQFPVILVTHKIALDVVLVFLENTVTECIVNLFYIVRLELLAEYGMGACVQGNYHHSAGILVKAVHNARSGYIALIGHLVYE